MSRLQGAPSSNRVVILLLRQGVIPPCLFVRLHSQTVVAQTDAATFSKDVITETPLMPIARRTHALALGVIPSRKPTEALPPTLLATFRTRLIAMRLTILVTIPTGVIPPPRLAFWRLVAEPQAGTLAQSLQRSKVSLLVFVLAVRALLRLLCQIMEQRHLQLLRRVVRVRASRSRRATVICRKCRRRTVQESAA